MTEERIAGLDGPIEIVRDSVGVPHCFATSEHDAFLAQGWVHATDRLWQMEYDRRRGLGRWAEVVGSPGVPLDRFYRRMDLVSSVRGDWTALATRTRAMLDSYTNGVNAAMRAGLPPSLAGIAVSPWEPWHSLLVFKVRHVMMGSARGKLWRALVTEVLGSDVADSMLSGGDHLACVPPGEPCENFAAAALTDEGGSNNWALSGARTASGLPLLAGDPHRELEVPNVYVQGHLSCPAWDVLGIGMPGVPGFPHFGHNSEVAWCITHGQTDDQDVYRFPSGAVEGERRTEAIGVRGGDAEEVEIVTTARGPLVTPQLALSWTASAATDTGFDAIPRMLDAGSVDDLFEAMRDWVAPGNNLLGADRAGAIGYLARGRVPLRQRLEGALLPVPGDDASYAWEGFLPFEEHPRLVNPAGGFVFSANNPALPTVRNPYLGIDVAAPWRARRVFEMLSATTAATVADMEAMQRDVVSLPARWWSERLAGWPPLDGWDGRMDKTSSAAAAYAVVRRELMLLALERSGLGEHLNDPLNRVFPGALPETALWRIVDQHARADNTSLLGGWTWDRALKEATARAGRRWKGVAWGELHQTPHRHPLGRAELNPPPVSYGGDMDTVQAASYLPSVNFDVRSASVARYAFDLADWDRSGWVIPLGASGEAGPHFADQQEAWRDGRLLPAPYTRAAVEAAASQRVVLRPRS